MISTRMERIDNNLEELGAGFVEGTRKGNYMVHPNINFPTRAGVKIFTVLVDLERWIQLKKQVIKYEKTGRDNLDLLQELDMLEKRIK